MIRSRFTFSALAIAALLATIVAVSPARAGIFTNALTNGSNILTDDSVGNIVDVTDIGTVSVGDYVQGIIDFQTVSGTNVNAVAGLYSMVITDISLTGVLTLAPINAAALTGNSISELLIASGFTTQLAGLTGRAGTIASDAVFAIFEKNDPAFNTSQLDAPLLNLGTLGGVISAGNGWTLDLIAGISDLTDFYQVRLLDGDHSTLPLDDNSDEPATFALYRTALTVNADNFGVVTYGNINRTDFNGNVGNGNIVSQTNNNISDSGETAFDNGWGFQDRGDFQMSIQIVPEPASMIVWGGLASAFGFAAYRRRNAAKAAK